MLLDYVDFISGAMTAVFAYAMFKDNADPSEESEDDGQYNEDEDEKNGRLVTISCQGCRKLKKHREVEYNLYQCTKCKRVVDLR